MFKTLLKAIGILVWLTWFNLVSAATMGGINVTSALGHPLQADISLTDLGKNDAATLVAKMATVNEFKGAGLDFPYSLPKLTFEVATRSNGEVYINLTSTQPVNEPFVTLLVELDWASGRLLREYTFLLDPAGFVPEQPKAVDVKPVEPMLPVPAVVAALIPVAAAKVEMVDMVKVDLAVPKKAAAEPAPVEAESVVPVEQVKMEPLTTALIAPAKTVADAASMLVEKGDTLGKIAAEVKPVDVSLERMLVAMYRANANKFEGKNMNRIKAGKILRMPDADEIDRVSQKTAVREIRAQVADWQDYRQKLAATQSTSNEQAPKHEAAGKISAAVAEKSQVIKDAAKEVLRLSKGESLDGKAVAANSAQSKKEELIATADDAVAKSKQLQEEQGQLKKLESISKDATKLLELKSQSVVPVEPPVAASAVAAQPAVAAEQDMLDSIMSYISVLLDNSVMLAVGVAAILGLGGVGFVISRRGKTVQKKIPKKNEAVGSATGSWRTPVAPSPDTGDFTRAATAMPAATADIDDVDPISEADLFLNFGRDVQAEEILKDALNNTPDNNQIKLKLLSIYVTRKDKQSFTKYAEEIKDSGDAVAWERTAVMGREIDPDNPDYGGAQGDVKPSVAVKPDVDFDLGLGADKMAAVAVGSAVAAQDFKMDFDLSGSQPSGSAQPLDLDVEFEKTTLVSKRNEAEVDATSILSRDMVKAAESASPMDFDVSGILPGEVKSLANSSVMDFDISGMIPEQTSKSVQENAMDFDVSSSMFENTAAIQVPLVTAESAKPATMDFNDLVFDIPSSKETPVEAAPAPKPVADEGMPFSIDFPISYTKEPSSELPAVAKKIDFDFGDININLDGEEPVAQADADIKDEHWHEVSTKLDLAKAYQEMGDADGAKEILDEVLRDGDIAQRESAEKLLQQIIA